MMRSNTGISGAHRRRRFGFTLVETLVATSISVVVLGGVASVYYWTSQQMVYAQRVSWSHLEALKSSRTLQYYLRGAQEVTAIDTNRAQWVEVRMADGSLTRLVYENPIQGQRDGFLYVTNSTGRHTIVARGMTAHMTDEYSPPVFRRMGAKSLRITYRVVEPVVSQPGATRDACIGAVIDTGVSMRNGSN